MNDVKRIADLYEKVDRIMYSSSTPLKKPVAPLSDKEIQARERTIQRQREIDQKTLNPDQLIEKRRKKQIKDAEEAAFNRTIKEAKFLTNLQIFGLELNKKREERGHPPIDWDVVFNQEGRRSDNIPEDRRKTFEDNYYKSNNIMIVVSPAGHKPTNWIIAHRVGHGLLTGTVLNQLESIIRVFRTTFEGKEDKNISEEEFFKMVSGFKSVAEDKLTDKGEYYNELLAEYITIGTVRFSDLVYTTSDEEEDEQGEEYNLSDYYKNRINAFFDRLLTNTIGKIIWE
jgi:hypothetical protein